MSITFSVAFRGIEACPVEVQCSLSPGLPGFSIVGLPDKAVSEAKERVRAALASMAIAFPSKKITINLSPADLPKEGSHFDLPIAVSLLAELQIIPSDAVQSVIALGELSLNGKLVQVAGALPAAMTAAEAEHILLCPETCGREAAWVSGARVIAANTLSDIVRHFNGLSPIEDARPGEVASPRFARDLRDVKGQERAKRALEIAAAGRHNMLMVGPPGSGKSMLAERLPGILPPLAPLEALETSMIHSIAGLLDDGGISKERPFCNPHHTSSMAALIGGGRLAKPGQVSLAHNGVLFLDELPEFARNALETLRQPVESGTVMISRANAHVKYPCRFMLIAAANPCKCGYMSEPDRACARVPVCGEEYLGRISGPLMDRFDLRVDVPPVSYDELDLPTDGERSKVVAARVKAAHVLQTKRFDCLPYIRANAEASGDVLQEIAQPEGEGRDLMLKAAERFRLSARGYHRVLRVARTIADLDGSEIVERPHIAEAISFRVPA